MSAAARVLPPLLVYSRVNMKAKQLYRIPGAIAACRRSGWRDQKASHNDSTVPWSCEVKEEPVTQDRHNSHTKHKQLLHFSQQNIVMRIPPHRTVETQWLAFLFHAAAKNFVIEIYSSLPWKMYLTANNTYCCKK
jgi:hypothetical protein